MNKPEVFIQHHSASSPQTTVQQINEWHRVRWPNFISKLGYHVGYHFVIDFKGRITQTRELNEEGAHCIGMNRRSIGVCFTGNFSQTHPTQAQLIAWKELHHRLVKEVGDLPVRPHRFYSKTECFGNLLPDNYFTLQPDKVVLKDNLRKTRVRLLQLLKRNSMK